MKSVDRSDVLDDRNLNLHHYVDGYIHEVAHMEQVQLLIY